MAAYASTVTLGSNKAQRIHGTGHGLLWGTIDITGYNATTTEETDITKHFIPETIGGTSLKCYLIMESTTDNGYTLQWTPSTGKFKAYQEAGTAAGARDECSTDTDVGAAQFVAYGRIAH